MTVRNDGSVTDEKMKNKKEEELVLIKELLQRLKYKQTSLKCTECPDFEMELKGKTVGIEITKYFSDISKKGSMTERRKNYLKKKGLWTNTSLQSGEVLPNESAIQKIIDKKGNLSKKYKNNFYQKWLIIYAGGSGLHDMFLNNKTKSLRQGRVLLVSLPQEEITYNIKSNYFTHILIWDKFTEKIFTLFPNYKKIYDLGEEKIWVNYLPFKN